MIIRESNNRIIAWNKFKSAIKTLDYQTECVKRQHWKSSGSCSLTSNKSFWTGVITNSKTQKVKFFITEFSRKCNQIRRKLRIPSHSLKKCCLMKNVAFGEVFENIYHLNLVSVSLLCGSSLMRIVRSSLSI